MPEPALPLILTLAMDDASFAHLDGLRRAHFPPERNLIPAHVTLFHHLPGEELAAICRTLASLARTTAPVQVEAGGLQFLGRGVAIRLASPELSALRAGLAREWTPWLGPQDRQSWRPHVTIQNKVPPDEARRLHEELGRSFRPFTIEGTGLTLWHYRGGPWEHAASLTFGAAGLPRLGLPAG
jgi:2'-5' RNA ligase